MVIFVFLMNFVESVLLIIVNDSFINIFVGSFIVYVFLIIGFYILFVYFGFMVYFVFCMDYLKDVKFYWLCLLLFYIIDLIINILMFVECIFKII